MLTVGSLFAGVGGFDLAMEAAGFALAFQVEIDPFCLQVLEKHWPTVPRFPDVRSCHGAITSSAASPVRTSPAPASASASKANAQASTANSSGSLTSASRAASSLKTCITPGSAGCPSCGASCGRDGMPLCRFACAPVILGPGTNAAASSSWPTLTHQSYGSNRGGANGRSGKLRPSLPTLMRGDSRNSVDRRLSSRGNPALLPTLIRRDARTEKGAARMPNSVGSDPLLPTLTRCGNYNRKGVSPTSGDGLATAVGGRLNPTWCEWYMGFPLDWTAVAWPPASPPSATPSSRRKSSGSRNGSSKLSALAQGTACSGVRVDPVVAERD